MSDMELSLMGEEGEQIQEDGGDNDDDDEEEEEDGGGHSDGSQVTTVTGRNSSEENHVEKRISNERRDPEHRRMVDITRDKPVKVTVRVVVPVRDHPKFNFVGKLLGPKGNSLKRLQENTMTKMAILGRGSMRDKLKEEELRSSGDPKFSHLHDDLHVEITAFAPPAEAHARIAYALSDVRRFLIPDYNDDIRQEQMWEMQVLKERPDPSPAESAMHLLGMTKVLKPLAGTETPTSTNSNESQSPSVPVLNSVSSAAVVLPSQLPASRIVGVHSLPVIAATAAGPVTKRKRPLFSSSTKKSLSPTKRTILSILDRARTAQSKQAIPGYQLMNGLNVV